MTTATENIESIMQLLGQAIHESSEEIIPLGSNAQLPGMTLSQEPEYLSDEEFFPDTEEHNPHKRSSCLQCGTPKSTSGRSLGRKTSVRQKRGPYLTWSDEERKILRDMMSQKVYRSWLQVRRDFNRKSTKRRNTNSI